MSYFSGPHKVGARMFTVSGILHILAPILDSFSSDSLMLAVVGIVYVAIAFVLDRGWRWFAYIAFLISLFGIVAATYGIYAENGGPGWLFLLILIANILAMASLFIALWRPKQPA